MNRRRFVFQNGTSLSKPLRRTGVGPVDLEISVWTLQGGSLDVELLESSEGTDWSVVADWRGHQPGWAHLGLVTPRLPWLRARLDLEKSRGAVLDLLLLEASDHAGDSSRERKDDKS